MKRRILILLILLIVIVIIFFKKGSKSYTANFIANGAHISASKLSCDLLENNSCYINAPKIEKTGSKIIGWSQDKNAETAEYVPLDKILLTKENTTFYAILEEHINTSETFKVGNYTVEIEEGILSSDIIDKLNYINEKMPFLFKINGKISFMSKETYNSIWGHDVVGTSETKTKTIDVVADNLNPLVLIHELAHNLDLNCMRYEKRKKYVNNNYEYFNKYYYAEISKSKTLGFNELYLKYKDLNAEERPLRDYSYKNIKEFFADSIASYFENQYYNSKSLKTNDEIIETVSKLIVKIDAICKL